MHRRKAIKTLHYLSCIMLGASLQGTALAEVELTVHPSSKLSLDDQVLAEEHVTATPGNASVITDKQWTNSRAETVKDITDYTPGIITQPRDGAESARLSVRGSGLANTFQGRGLLVLQDGIPINMADGEFEFPVIDPWLIRFAEVFPGANALEYGASTFGGAINFFTPTGATDPGYTLRFEGGSFGTLHAQASYGKAWQGGDLFSSAGDLRQDGVRDHNMQTTSRFYGNLGLSDGDFTNRIYISHTHGDAEIPGAISLAQLYDNEKAANPLNINGNYQRNLDITRIADKSAWADGNNRIDTTVFYTYRTLDNPVTTYEYQNNNDFGMSAKFTHSYDLSNWLIGMNNYYGTADETRYQNIGGRPGLHILDRNLTALTSEAFAEVTQHVAGRLYAIAGAQGDYSARNIYQRFPTDARQTESYMGFNPRLGLRYDLAAETQFFTNLSHSFEPPTWSELSGGNVPGFHQLKAQHSNTAELGMRGALAQLHWQASYYHGWLRNEFVNYRFADGSTSTINAHQSKRDGIELGLDGNVARDVFRRNDAVSLRTAYSYSRFTLDHDPIYGNNSLPGVPEHYLRAEALYHHPSGISIGPNIEWSPKPMPVDLTHSLSTDAYAIYGMRTFWESADGKLNIYLEGRNLLDKTYIATNNVIPSAGGVDGRYFYPGEGRAVYAGVKWKL